MGCSGPGFRVCAPPRKRGLRESGVGIIAETLQPPIPHITADIVGGGRRLSK